MEKFEYKSIKQILEEYPFTIGQLRFHLNNRHKNGLKTAIRKIGKRLYIRKDLLDQWIESQAERGGVR